MTQLTATGEAGRAIAGMAGFALDIPGDTLLGSGRGAARIAYGRHIAMYLAHTGLGLSLSRVGDAFGRDKSTVSHACSRIEDLRDDAAFDAWLEALEEAVSLLEEVRTARPVRLPGLVCRR